MSATTPANKREQHPASGERRGFRHHARQPYGLLIIGCVIFVAAWAFWTFVLASPATAPVP